MKRFLPIAGLMLLTAAGARGQDLPDSRPVRLWEGIATGTTAVRLPLQDDPEAAQALRERRRAIRENLLSMDDAEERIASALGWANWELAEAAGGPMTRWVLGLRTRRDLEEIGEIARCADEALSAAQKDLDSLPAAADNAEKRRRARWKDTLAALRSFANGFEALAQALPVAQADLSKAQAACRTAALELAELRETDDADTAAAAKLWQAILLDAGGRPRQALAVLDLAMAVPKRLPYDFFGRVLRCAILTEGGSYALVTGLALQMREKCSGWFDGNTEAVRSARLTLDLLQVRCLLQWAQSGHASHQTESEARRQRAEEILNQSFTLDKTAKLYRLVPATPLLAEFPTAAPRSDAPDTASSRAASRRVESTRPGHKPPEPRKKAGNQGRERSE